MSNKPTVADKITIKQLPHHVAIIMDGNNRWARREGVSTAAGHKAGVEAVRNVLKVSLDYNIQVVTLFAFSSENWQRSSFEVKALMTLFAAYLKSEIKKLNTDSVRVRFIGDRQRFSKGLIKQMVAAETLTQANTRTTLVIAVDYGGQRDIVQAAQQLAVQVKNGELEPEQIDEERLNAHIALADLPKPDLCIRTSGEQRISNFLIWQLAYAELYFTPVLWPDFGEAEMILALQAFSERSRRFGSREGQLTAVDNGGDK
jgi:undecaprenyl diphosphate synthase